MLVSTDFAHAHPAPAEAPDFGSPGCMTVVHKDQQPNMNIGYSVASDVTVLGPGDLPLGDANTYQLFAFEGVVFPRDARFQLYPYHSQDAEALDLPLWITSDDVKRAAKASQTIEGTLLSQSSIPTSTVLAGNPAFEGLWLRINQDDARVPITMAHAATGVSWDLRDVAPGSYTVVSYIFSPPYNGWAIRPGVVKVTDAEHELAAGSVDSTQEVVLSSQGRRVGLCLDTPPGTQLSAYFLIEERPEVGWTEWIGGRDVSSGRLDLCFHSPQPELTGSVRLRFDLTGPEGQVTTVHSPDTFTALIGSGDCVASSTLCCDFEGAMVPAADCCDGGAAEDSGSSRAVDSGPDRRRPLPKVASAAGCGSMPREPTRRQGWFALAMASVLAWRRRTRT